MKKLTFLTNMRRKVSAKGRLSDVSLDRRLTVGSPSGLHHSTLLKLVSVLVLILTVGVGNAWGTSVTWPGTTALPGTATSIANDANVTIKTSSTNTYTNPIRVYANTTITIEVANGYTIESVTYEASSTGNYVTYAQNATVSPSVTPTVSGKNVTWSYTSTTTKFTFKPSSQTRSNGITVVYKSTGGGSNPSLTADPTSLDWGTVVKGASLSTKTFSISGSNLTSGSLSISASTGWSVSPTSQAVNGTLSSTTITVTPPSTATAGTKDGTITISGGGLASNVTVSCGLVVNEIDQFIDEVQSTSGYTSASPHVEAGSYGTTPTLSDKTVATSGTCEQQHYHFVGWITSDKYTAGTAIADGDLQTPTSATGETYYAVWAKQAAGGGGDVSDIINNAATTDALGSTGTSTWASDFTVTGSNSSAVYTIHSMGINGATNYALQWNKNAYLYTSTAPTSGLKLKSITITTLADKSIALYGATSAYAAKADATSLVSQSFGTSGTTYSLTAAQLSSNYTCVGINGTTSSTQIVSITITYSGGVSYEDYIAKCCTPLGTINGSFLLT